MVKFITIKRILFTFLIGICFLIPTIVKSASWHSDFGRRKSITINNPNGTTLTNYQVKFTLHEGDGTDTTSDIYLNNVALSNFDDIRFAQADGTTLLDYWIESVSSGTAVVWVEINSLQASTNSTIYIYYGNSSATSQSNAQTTFPFFDYFDVNGISGWTGSTEDLDHAQETGNQSQTVNTSKYESSPNSAQLHTYASCFSGPFSGVKSLITASPGLGTGNYLVEFGVKMQITGFRYNTGGVQRSRVRINGVEKFYDEIGCSGSNCTAEGSWSDESFALTNSTISTIALVGDAYDCIEGNTYYDNVRVRHYVATEPIVTTVGTVETLTSSTSPSSATAIPSANNASICSDLAPEGVPDLFQIDSRETSATLYFTPLSDTSTYFISYSTDASAEEHSVQVDLGRDGVQNFTINALASKATYYFKVRGQKGCMPGSWSNIRSTSTSGFVLKQAPLTSPSVIGEEIEIDKKSSRSPKKITKNVDVQTHDVLIKVEHDGKPLADASVELHSKPMYGSTNKKGEVLFTGVEKGVHSVKIAYKGFVAQEKLVVNDNKKKFDVSINVELKRDGILPTWAWVAIIVALVTTAILVFKRRELI